MHDVMLQVLFVGGSEPDFVDATAALTADDHVVEHVASPFRALAASTADHPDIIVVDASRLDDQMLEVFEALTEVTPESLLLAAVNAASRARAARLLRLGSDAVIGLPVDAAEVLALAEKRRQPEPVAGEADEPDEVGVDEKFQWLGEFAAGVAHNINNPLTTVIGYLQILSSQQSTAQTTNVLPTLLRECDRISEVVKNLLLLAGKANVHPREVDVNRVVERALAQADEAVHNDHITTRRTLQPGLPRVLADEEALKTACEHIATHARHAMRDGGTLNVETREEPPGRIRVRFTDTGPGIPPDELPKMFEPFVDPRTGGANGLGLAASYGIVKSFGGTIHVLGNNGSGTTLEVDLPASG
jgi:signal transduction histidine kinase